MDFSLLLALWVLGVDWDLGRPVVVTLVVVGIAFRIAVGIAVVVPIILGILIRVISLGIVRLLVLLEDSSYRNSCSSTPSCIPTECSSETDPNPPARARGS